MVVHHVEVDPVGAGGHDVRTSSQAGEVGGKDGRSDSVRMRRILGAGA